MRALALVLLLAADRAGAETSSVHLTADRLVREPDGSVMAEGHVRLQDGPMQVAGERIRYDPHTGVARSDEPVTVVDGLYLLRARSFELLAGPRTGTFRQVELVQKYEYLSPEVVFASPGLQRPGKNRLVLSARSVERREDGSLLTIDPVFTLCDCGDDELPSWRFAASRATVVPGESVSMVFPRLELPRLPLPPLPLPYLSLPLSPRRTGLLPPLLGYSPNRGAEFEQPLYLVLGPSYDATLAAGWFTGSLNSTPSTFRGPRVSTEFRYAPRVGSDGRAFVQYGRDLTYFEQSSATAAATGPSMPRLLNRSAYQLEEQDDWGLGLADHANVALVSDRPYISDFTDDVRLRGQQVLRSTAWIDERQGSLLASVWSLYNQDLRPAPSPAPSPSTVPIIDADRPELFGPKGTRVTFEHLPVLSLDLAHLALGPAVASMEAELARIAPLSGMRFSDAGVDGITIGDTGWLFTDCGEHDGRLEAVPGSCAGTVEQVPARRTGGSSLTGGLGETTSATRLSLRPTVSAPLLLPPWVGFRPYAGYRENLYAYDMLPDGGAGWGLFGASAQTEIARVYPGAGVRHAISPRLEVRRLIPGPGTSAPPRPYDEIDLGPQRAETQSELSVATRLDRLDGSTFLEAELGQYATLAPQIRAYEGFASGALTAGPARLTGAVSWSPLDLRLTQIEAAGFLTSHDGDQLRVNYLFMAAGGSAHLRAGPDELFSTGPPILQLEGLQQLAAGVTYVPARGFALRYDILILFTRDQLVKIQGLPDPGIVGPLQQSAALTYTSPCNCWGGAVTAYYSKGQVGFPGLAFSLDLGGLLRL